MLSRPVLRNAEAILLLVYENVTVIGCPKRLTQTGVIASFFPELSEFVCEMDFSPLRNLNICLMRISDYSQVGETYC